MGGWMTTPRSVTSDGAITSTERIEPPEPTTESADYYDILVLGRTGMGKSSTVNKLMATNTLQTSREQQIMVTAYTKDTTLLENGNLKAIVFSRDPNEIGNTKDRTNIITGNKSNKEAATLQGDDIETGAYMYKSSRNCQLLENTDSYIRILDPPGFYRNELMEGANNTHDSNLIIVRQVFCMQINERIMFNRILYFLPQNGPLIRSERALLEEIQQLVNFFGSLIFEHVVLVATMPPHISRNSEIPSEKKFPQKQLDQSRRTFQETLRKVLNTSVPPHPPIIFIAMTDTGEETLEKIRTAPVENDDALQLEFSSKKCRKCGIEIGINRSNIEVCEHRKPGDAPWANATPLENTFCHPSFTPRCDLKSIFSWEPRVRIAQCTNCGRERGSHGCSKVNTVNTHQP